MEKDRSVFFRSVRSREDEAAPLRPRSCSLIRLRLQSHLHLMIRQSRHTNHLEQIGEGICIGIAWGVAESGVGGVCVVERG